MTTAIPVKKKTDVHKTTRGRSLNKNKVTSQPNIDLFCRPNQTLTLCVGLVK